MSAINIDGWRGLLGTKRYDICALWGVFKVQRPSSAQPPTVCPPPANEEGKRRVLSPAALHARRGGGGWGANGLQGRESAVQVSADGKVVAEGASTFFLNQTQHFGKGMRACPAAFWDDALFDMSWIASKRRGEVRLSRAEHRCRGAVGAPHARSSAVCLRVRPS
eukprot:SAG11_NODE_1895_length_4093_cov_4.148473_2_plen_165_part_00